MSDLADYGITRDVLLARLGALLRRHGIDPGAGHDGAEGGGG